MGKLRRGLWLLWLLSSMAHSQESPVTVTVGEGAFLYDQHNGEVAPITITENYPTALQDGFISLMGRSNPEQTLAFISANVQGSAIGYSIERTPLLGYHTLIVEIDADDSAIDSITITPSVYINFHTDTQHWDEWFSPIGLGLLDGHPMLFGEGNEMLPAGAPAGIGEDIGGYRIGIWGNVAGITIGSSQELELAVGETVTLQQYLNGEPREEVGFTHVESVDPSIVSVDSYSNTQVVVTGQSPGVARVQARTSIARTGYVYVTVSEASPVPDPEPEPEPQPEPEPDLEPDLEPERNLLVGFYKLDEGQGNVMFDASGRDRTGSVLNSAGWTGGVEGNALRLDGVDDYAEIDHDPGFNAFPLSIAFWVKTDATGQRSLVNKYPAGSFNGYQVFMNDGNLCAWYFRDDSNHVWDGSSCTLATSGVNDNRWHHVAFVVNEQGGLLYVDGSQTATLGWTGEPGSTTTTQSLSLGHYPGTEEPYLSGSLDEVRIYHGALEASAIREFASVSPPAEPEPEPEGPPVTITVADPPLLHNSMVNDLARITITENYPSALRDGYFQIHAWNHAFPDVDIEFEGAAVLGSVGQQGAALRSISNPQADTSGLNLLVQVDADEETIDTITIDSRAYFHSSDTSDGRTAIAVGFIDGDGSGNESGMPTSATGDYALGWWQLWQDLGLGDNLTLAVGETAELPIDPAEAGIEAPYELFRPTAFATLEASIENDLLLLTGVSPGSESVIVTDRWGIRDLLEVQVVATGGTPEPEPQPEPEPPQEEPQPTPEPEPQPEPTSHTVKITVGEPPIVYNTGNGDTPLAPIIITETYPAALNDGYISLVGMSNPEYELRFTSNSRVSGSVSNFQVVGTGEGPALLIEVDADDDVIDTIRIDPLAYIHFHVHEYDMFRPVGGDLRDGYSILTYANGEMLPPAVPAGVSFEPRSYGPLGLFGGLGGVEIGTSSSLVMSPGETTTLEFNMTEPLHQAYIVESVDPSIVTVDTYTRTGVTFTAQRPGQTRVQVYDYHGRSGYVLVEVLEASAPEPPPQSQPEPAPEPQPEPEPQPAPTPPPNPSPAPIPEPQPAPTPAPQPQPSPNSQAEEEEPAVSLPVLGRVAAVGSDEAPLVIISGGALAEGDGEPRAEFSPEERVVVAGEIMPEEAQQDLPADLFVVVKVTTPAGFSAWFQKNANGRFIRWSGSLEALRPMKESEALSAVERLDVHAGRLLPGEYEVYFGYVVEGGALVYSQEPLEIRVQ